MKKLLLALVTCQIVSPVAFAQTPTHRFASLGHQDETHHNSEAKAITPDGATIFGYGGAFRTYDVPLRWHSTDHWQSSVTPSYPPDTDFGANYDFLATSADGNVVVGWRANPGTAASHDAVYWTPANNFQPVPVPGSQTTTASTAVSGDGRYIVGTTDKVVADPNGAHHEYNAFWWDRTQATAILLPPYNVLAHAAQAFAVSDDGRRAAGETVTSNTGTVAACYWDNSGAPVLLNHAGETIVAVVAIGMTPDGSVIVGAGHDYNQNVQTDPDSGKDIGFIWTAATERVQKLPMPADIGVYNFTAAAALSISRNGRLIVGTGSTSEGGGRSHAIYWEDDQGNGIFSPHVIDGEAQLPSSWNATVGFGADYFGNTICGSGYFADGPLEGFVFVVDVNLPPPALAPPKPRLFFDAATHTLTIRYQTVPGLKYRVIGGTNVTALAPLTSYAAGLGDERGYSATNNNGYFLQVQVAPN